MDIVHETFFDGTISYNLANETGFFVGLAWNAITTQLINASNLGIGCPQRVNLRAVVESNSTQRAVALCKIEVHLPLSPSQRT
jgi:hypothetical protein